MRSLILDGPQTVRLAHADSPALRGPRSAVVRVTHSSICGSDLGPYLTGPSRDSYPMGHEGAGVVLTVGSDVTGVRPGDRVVISGTAGCGACGMCARQEAMLCESTPYPPVYGHGFPGLGGCQSDELEVPEADFNLFVLPDGIPSEVGVLLADTLATASAAVARAAVPDGGSVAVIGLGAVGLQAIMAAQARGVRDVIAFDPIPERRAFAADLGARVLDPSDVDPATLDGAVDSVVDAQGSAQTLVFALSLIKKGGSVAVVGLPKEPSVPFPAQLAMGKSATVAYVACSIQAQVPELIRQLESGRLPVGPLVDLFTHRLPLEQGADAYRLFSSREGGTIKILLTTEGK